ncbi:MAG TPA: CbtB-domain containing protein [Stellaceae bacterium]
MGASCRTGDSEWRRHLERRSTACRSLPATGSPAAARSDTLIAAVMAAVLGVFVIWGVGFAPIGALHNAAHDTRHSMALPCH